MSTDTEARGVGLLVDDDPLYLSTLQKSLRKRDIESVTATTIAEALERSSNHRVEFALIDLRLGAESGLDLIEPLREQQPGIRIILVTGYASIATAVEAMKRGADNYLPKPATAQMILKALASPAGPSEPLEAGAAMMPLSRLEWEHIHQALTDANGNVSAAARLLGMHRRTLQRKLSKRPAPERRSDDEDL